MEGATPQIAFDAIRRICELASGSGKPRCTSNEPDIGQQAGAHAEDEAEDRHPGERQQDMQLYHNPTAEMMLGFHRLFEE